MRSAISALRQVTTLIAQIAFLWLINWFCHLLVAAFHLPVPGNVVAVLVLFALLQSGVVPLRYVDRSATLMLSHLGLFFLPIAVGLMTFAGLWMTNGLSILATLIASAIVGFAVTGRVCQRLMRTAGRRAAPLIIAGHEPDPDRS